ncbi:MAG TPA: uracil-DNA glycosylase [Gaiellales bacterium]|nr:uracil-DNA glycosylase [Gaiellales bacterium]
MEHLLAELAGLRIGATFNQYADAGPDDVPDAPCIRLENLRAYLGERAGADVVCLGEAGGYQGMRWSGIAFTSERDLLRWGPPYRATCAARTWSEPSGTIVHKVLAELGAERRVILWNTVPTHPHRPGEPRSNRRPTVAEVAAGAPLAMRLIELVRPRTVVAVGRIAESVLPVGTAYVRHPANAGGPAFREGMRAILAAPPRAPI